MVHLEGKLLSIHREFGRSEQVLLKMTLKFFWLIHIIKRISFIKLYWRNRNFNVNELIGKLSQSFHLTHRKYPIHA